MRSEGHSSPGPAQTPSMYVAGLVSNESFDITLLHWGFLRLSPPRSTLPLLSSPLLLLPACAFLSVECCSEGECCRGAAACKGRMLRGRPARVE
eukprot:1149345-Pelagomonas_calceolata.AAC.2